MTHNGLDPIWAERVRRRCHVELARRARRSRAGRLLDAAAIAAVCAYVAVVFAVVLHG